MKNFRAHGDILTVTAPYDIVSGAGVLVGDIFGIAQTDAAEGDPVAIKTTGVFEMGKVSAQAWTAGVAVYWDDDTGTAGTGDGAATTTSSSNTLIGVAVEAADNPSDTGLVRLNGVFGI